MVLALLRRRVVTQVLGTHFVAQERRLQTVLVICPRGEGGGTSHAGVRASAASLLTSHVPVLPTGTICCYGKQIMCRRRDA